MKRPHAIPQVVAVMLGISLVGCNFTAAAPKPQAAVPTVASAPTQSEATQSGTSIGDTQSRDVIIDTDVATDDWMAILYLLQHPNIRVQAITVTGVGEAHCAPGVRNVLGLVALAEHEPIPVACGRDTPLQGNHAFPADWRSLVDSMRGLSLPAGQNPSKETSAVNLLISLIRPRSKKISLLTLGPLTNVAELFQTAPDTFQKIDGVFIMGGAVRVPGNLGAAGIPNQLAEWNIYADPHAANIVFSAGAPVTLVPLDATNHVPLRISFLQKVEANQHTPEAAYVYQILMVMRSFIDAGGYYFWDPLAAGIMVHEDLASYETDNLCVVEGDGPQSGQTQIGTACPRTRVAADADGTRFMQEFLNTLNGLPDTVEPVVTPSIAPILGTWKGSALNNGVQMEVSVTIDQSCQLGKICGRFDIPKFSCSGTFTWVGMDGELYQFQAGDKTPACGEGNDYLGPQADGTVLYISRGAYGETRGTLQRQP